MHLSRIRIRNYKSFYDSGEIEFSPGANVIIGPNSSGKTALLEALSLKISNKPHMAHPTLARDVGFKGLGSSLNVTISIPGDELKRRLKKSHSVIVPGPKDGRIDDAIGRLNACLENSLDISATVGTNGIASSLRYAYDQKAGGYNDSFMRVDWKNDGFANPENSVGGADESNSLGRILIDPFVASIYRFYAERLNTAKCPVGDGEVLNQDASNLAEVLQVLQTRNPHRFEKFMELVTEVFPMVKWISAETQPEEKSTYQKPIMIELKIWSFDKETERHDLAIPLSECGTGIGQGLAILYVLVSSEGKARTLIIDEPQSFLHPGAAKKLMQILWRYPEHQYFISTHSPEILAAANPSAITGLSLVEGESIPKSLTKDQIPELRDVFRRVGVSFADVFYADSILWVEGATEKIAFPLILKANRFSSETLRLTLEPLSNTGDVQSKKNARLVLNIYNKLSGAHALVPPVVAIVLDRETLNDEKIKEFETLSDLVTFIPRRCFENYLLDAEAIAAVTGNQENFSSPALQSTQVAKWLDKQRKGRKYLDEPTDDMDEKTWLRRVDGAKLLSKLFAEFSDTRVTYQKTVHSIELTEWLLKHKPSHFKELTDFLLKTIENGEGGSDAVATGK